MVHINCTGLSSYPSLPQRADIEIGNYGPRLRYGLSEGIVPKSHRQRGRVNENELNPLATIFHSKVYRQIWQEVCPDSQPVIHGQYIVPIPEHLMVIDHGALFCLLLTIQLVRDVKTKGVVAVRVGAEPHSVKRSRQG
jgi:hypothetical protein